MVVISVARVGQKWAVQHGGGFLGHTSSLEEATSIGRDLVSWLRSQGRQAELIVGETIATAPADSGDASVTHAGVQQQAAPIQPRRKLLL